MERGSGVGSLGADQGTRQLLCLANSIPLDEVLPVVELFSICGKFTDSILSLK